MKIIVPLLSAAISLSVFACSESPSSSGDGGGKSLGSGVDSTFRACEYSTENEKLGFSGVVECQEAASSIADFQKFRAECIEDDGVLVETCPAGEKISCISEDDDDEFKDIGIKYYMDGLTCGDLGLKNADGSDDKVYSKGGACGPYMPEPGLPLSTCMEFPERSTSFIKLLCIEIGVPFREECSKPSADLVCYHREEKMVSYFYGEVVSSFGCDDFKMDNYP